MEIKTNNGVCAPKGFYANGLHCGIRKNKNKYDLSLIYSNTLCVAASMYTQNKVKGAPILVSQEHLHNDHAQAIIINSGNANTCNSDGYEVAKQMCDLCANELRLNTEDVLVASTGVIGQKLNIEPIAKHIKPLIDTMSRDKSLAAMEGIMTTDTLPKMATVSFTIDGTICTLGAMAKGSGMIHPNMATMLAFVTSDVNIQVDLLKEALREVVDATFNMISVDGDTSTNDMITILCNGQANNTLIRAKDENYTIFKDALYQIAKHLSLMIAKDGEGATKLLRCVVNHARSLHDARNIAKSVIASSLVKSAMFGCDANWGRILCAIGYSDAQYNPETIDVTFKSEIGEIQVCQSSQGLVFDEDIALQILQTNEIYILIDLHDGTYSSESYGCDLTYDYVKINGDYRT